MNVVTPKLEIESTIARLSAARARGADWLASRVAADGEPVGGNTVNHYYRLPWALAIAGRIEEAARALSWIERNALTDKGDLRPGPAQTNWNKVGWTHDAASYPLAIIATGAWHLEHYDTALAIMDTLQAFQHPATGGGFVERPEFRKTGEQDLLCTAQIGLAGLVTGRRAAADAAFGWIERLYDAQPELPNRLYLCWGDKGLVTDVPAERAFGHYIDFAKPRQAYFNPGIGAAFMARQFEYQDTVHVGKFAWGSGAMLDIDADDLHLNAAMKMANWLVDCQSPDGRWNPTHFNSPDPDDTDALWKTGEHILLSSIVLAALAAYPRKEFGGR